MKEPDKAMNGCYGFGPFRLDVQKRRLWRDDEIVGITPKAFDTLLFLVRHAGQIVQREDLLRMVWCDTFVADETVAQNISAVRKALGDTRSNILITSPSAAQGLSLPS